VFKRFFGKKNDGFFLQMEDENAAPKPEAKAKDPAPAKPEAVATPAAVTAEAASTVAPATGAAANGDKTVAKAEEKAAKAAKRSAGKAETPKVAAAPAPVAVAAPPAPAITNFATDYLIKPSSISGRRLPGANMNKFLELARQVEKPKAFKAAASERRAEK
jgi:hypothetical protein